MSSKTNPIKPSSNSPGRSSLKPDLAALYRARAEVDLKRKEPTSSQRERALHDLETAIRLEPQVALSTLRPNQSRELLHREGRDDALAACEAALTVDPNFSRPIASGSMC